MSLYVLASGFFSSLTGALLMFFVRCGSLSGYVVVLHEFHVLFGTSSSYPGPGR